MKKQQQNVLIIKKKEKDIKLTLIKYYNHAPDFLYPFFLCSLSISLLYVGYIGDSVQLTNCTPSLIITLYNFSSNCFFMQF